MVQVAISRIFTLFLSDGWFPPEENGCEIRENPKQDRF
jgi:hypothetical protein